MRFMIAYAYMGEKWCPDCNVHWKMASGRHVVCWELTRFSEKGYSIYFWTLV